MPKDGRGEGVRNKDNKKLFRRFAEIFIGGEKEYKMKTNKLATITIAALVVLGMVAVFAGNVTPTDAETIAYMAGMALI